MRSKFLILAILFIVVLLVGCGKTTSEVDDEETIFEPVDDTDEAAEAESEQETPAESETEAETPTTPVEPKAESEAESESETTVEKTNVKKVIMQDIKFEPSDLIISPGTTVIWEHKDKFKGNENIKHMVLIHGVEKSGILKYGDSYSYTFNETGKLTYIDVMYKASMRGTITVE